VGVGESGLYAESFATDLRTIIKAVARLPYDGDKLLELLCESEEYVSSNPDDPDYPTFWLVIADQFSKHGIVCERAHNEALAIIACGVDVLTREKSALKPTDLRKRQRWAEDLRARITNPSATGKRRATLKRPEEFVMEIGDVFVYPTFGGRCINPRFASREQDRLTPDAPSWTQDGWAAMVILDRGRAFDFLAWYRPLVIAVAKNEKPSFEQLHGEQLWRVARPCTCSPLHLRRMRFEKVGALPIDDAKLQREFPEMTSGASAALDDYSIANSVSVGPHVPEVLMPRPYATIPGIEQILAER